MKNLMRKSCEYSKTVARGKIFHDNKCHFPIFRANHEHVINLCRPFDTTILSSTSFSEPPKITYDNYIDLFDDDPLPDRRGSPSDNEIVAQSTNDIWQAALVPVETQPPPPCL